MTPEIFLWFRFVFFLCVFHTFQSLSFDLTLVYCFLVACYFFTTTLTVITITMSIAIFVKYCFYPRIRIVLTYEYLHSCSYSIFFCLFHVYVFTFMFSCFVHSHWHQKHFFTVFGFRPKYFSAINMYRNQ